MKQDVDEFQSSDSEDFEAKEWNLFSLEMALSGMEEDEGLYSVDDIIEFIN